MPKSPPACELRRPGTFSRTKTRGRPSLTKRANSKKRADLRPLIPSFRCPLATETSWHGNPAAQTSAEGMSAPRRVRTSSVRGTSGQCSARMSRQKGSISHWKAILKPASSKPLSSPPIPAKSETSECPSLCPFASRSVSPPPLLQPSGAAPDLHAGIPLSVSPT